MEIFILNIVALTALYFSIRFLKSILLWGFRQELFTIRDNLFSMQFLENEAINYELYHIFRNNINSRIRYAHNYRLSFALLMRKAYKTEAFKVINESKYSTNGLRKEFEKKGMTRHIELLDLLEKKTALFYVKNNAFSTIILAVFFIFKSFNNKFNMKIVFSNGFKKIKSTTSKITPYEEFGHNNEPSFV